MFKHKVEALKKVRDAKEVRPQCSAIYNNLQGHKHSPLAWVRTVSITLYLFQFSTIQISLDRMPINTYLC